MTAQFRLSTISAVYEGGGFFRKPDGYWAFVKRQYRPAWLREGCAYRLTAEREGAGVIYTVEGEAV